MALALALCLLSAASPGDQFAEGLRLFDEAAAVQRSQPSAREEAARRFRLAARAFTAVWSEGACSALVLLNAANAHAFAGDLGEAVLFYRRALAVDPGNRDARDGLEHLRERMLVKRERSSAASLARSLFFWHDESTFGWRLVSFYTLFPAGWVLLTLAILRRRSGRRGSGTASAGAILVFLALVVLGSLVVGSLEHPIADDAVLLVETIGRKGNGDNYSPSHHRPGRADEAAPLPPGTELRVRERRDGGGVWLQVELLDGSRSWVPERTVEMVIRPAEPAAPSGGT